MRALRMRHSPSGGFTNRTYGFLGPSTTRGRYTYLRPMEAMPTAGVGGASPHRPDERLLTPAEVAALFRVNPKTVSRWARSGKLHAIRTLGGHRRFRASEVRENLERLTAAG